MTPAKNAASLGVACALALVLAAAMSACGGSDAVVTPSLDSGPSTQLFEGQLTVGGSSFYSFDVATAGLANVMLASVTTTPLPGTSSSVVLGLALGTPSGTDCTITNAVTTAASLTSPLVNNLAIGTYCVRVYDIGNLKVPVNFAIRIVHT